MGTACLSRPDTTTRSTVRKKGTPAGYSWRTGTVPAELSDNERATIYNAIVQTDLFTVKSDFTHLTGNPPRTTLIGSLRIVIDGNVRHIYFDEDWGRLVPGDREWWRLQYVLDMIETILKDKDGQQTHPDAASIGPSEAHLASTLDYSGVAAYAAYASSTHNEGDTDEDVTIVQHHLRHRVHCFFWWLSPSHKRRAGVTPRRLLHDSSVWKTWKKYGRCCSTTGAFWISAILRPLPPFRQRRRMGRRIRVGQRTSRHSGIHGEKSWDGAQPGQHVSYSFQLRDRSEGRYRHGVVALDVYHSGSGRQTGSLRRVATTTRWSAKTDAGSSNAARVERHSPHAIVVKKRGQTCHSPFSAEKGE